MVLNRQLWLLKALTLRFRSMPVIHAIGRSQMTVQISDWTDKEWMKLAGAVMGTNEVY